MKKTKWIALALVGGLALGASAMGCHHRHPGGKMAYYGDKIVKKMSKKLDLDEAQKAKLDAMKETMLQARKDFKEERGNQMEDFVAMLRSEDFNEKKANDWLDKKQAKMEETRRTLVSQFGEFHASLKPEQREKMAAMVEKKARCHMDKEKK